MNVTIYTHAEFERQFKRLKKKYHSLVTDYRNFLTDLKERPFQGSSLGNGVRKVRMGVSDKGGGKSGGLRVITFSVNKIDDVNIEITLLYIYDKGEIGNVSDKFLSYLINS